MFPSEASSSYTTLLQSFVSHLHDTLEEVLNVGADSSDSSQLFLLAEPFLHLDGIVVHLVDIHGQVLELLGQSASWTRHLHSSGLDLHLDTLGNLDQLEGVDFLHSSESI